MAGKRVPKIPLYNIHKHGGHYPHFVETVFRYNGRKAHLMDKSMIDNAYKCLVRTLPKDQHGAALSKVTVSQNLKMKETNCILDAGWR